MDREISMDMNTGLQIRQATPFDSSELAILADMATRSLNSFLWGLSKPEGQSPFEFGREIVRNQQSSRLHFSNWQVAEAGGKILGGMISYNLNTSLRSTPNFSAAQVLEPLNALKRLVENSWYVAALAVYHEARGQQVGRSLLCKAEQMASTAKASQISLMVGSFNPRAYSVYQKFGFQEKARRDFVPFIGSDKVGSWILMTKSLDLAC
jgi:ribosomal protein S18 acetylase RimI-like enzyme